MRLRIGYILVILLLLTIYIIIAPVDENPDNPSFGHAHLMSHGPTDEQKTSEGFGLSSLFNSAGSWLSTGDDVGPGRTLLAKRGDEYLRFSLGVTNDMIDRFQVVSYKMIDTWGWGWWR